MYEKVKKFIELQKAVNNQIDSKGEADVELVDELIKVSDSLNSHECEIAIELWMKEMGITSIFS